MAVKYYLVVMGVSLRMLCTLQKNLTGRYRENRPGYPAIAISDVSHLSCVSNDFGYEYVFSRFVEAVGKEGDVLFDYRPQGILKYLKCD